ncbi:ABC transporter ATP-binding protein YojI [Thiorhodovibrio litoralis]|nr:cyclic peptide export ABC transporter [Thiorhodovibrio winogradskyi]WPL11259.1 ABC transporter ATP-binding protein YojI [Thiorhodovibrio litoralis]
MIGARLLRELWRLDRVRTLVVGALAMAGALAQVACLMILTLTARDILLDRAPADFKVQVLLFMASLCLAVGLKFWSLRGWADLTEELSAELLIATNKELAAADLRTIETLGQAEILARLTGDMKTLSAGVWSLMAAVQTVTILFGALLSLLLFAFGETLIIGLMTALFFLIIGSHYERIDHAHHASLVADDRFQQRLRDLILGFQDLAMDRIKAGRFIRKSLKPAATGFRRLRMLYARLLARQSLFFDIYVFTMAGWILFIAPVWGMTQNVIIVVGVFFYVLDRIELLSVQLAQISAGTAAVEQLDHLRARLPAPETRSQPRLDAFGQIRMQALEYHYCDPDGQTTFTIGPIDLCFEAGKIYLIQGGNGSGKSTLMKLLTGLYEPHAGRILLDDAQVSIHAYRSLFSTVFTDFHLFETLHGLEEIDSEQAKFLLRKFAMQRKVSIAQGAFSTTDLSTGQRKRLALIAACLEKRPVYVLDEWTADQDPEFRHFFFAELLPWLKQQGHTIFAVTHDDRYFGYGDYALRLDAGQVRVLEPKAPGHT